MLGISGSNSNLRHAISQKKLICSEFRIEPPHILPCLSLIIIILLTLTRALSHGTAASMPSPPLRAAHASCWPARGVHAGSHAGAVTVQVCACACEHGRGRGCGSMCWGQSLARYAWHGHRCQRSDDVLACKSMPCFDPEATLGHAISDAAPHIEQVEAVRCCVYVHVRVLRCRERSWQQRGINVCM